jgi:hypothetical protein
VLVPGAVLVPDTVTPATMLFTSPTLLVAMCTFAAGTLAFWLSRGRGGFGLGQATSSTFYALLSTGELRCRGYFGGGGGLGKLAGWQRGSSCL